MLRTKKAIELLKEIRKAKRDGSLPDVNMIRGKSLVYYEFGSITIHEVNELLDECFDANYYLIDKGARPFI